jgi:tryptophan 2,3-dioxygenase
MKYPAVQYHDYLQLESLLNAQHRQSEKMNNPVHDEMLFIVVHQVYEIWFKQILWEIDSILKVFTSPKVEENSLGLAIARLERVLAIQKLINGQIDILETMTPMDFLEFRDYLYPASGFQSLQWKLLETKLGLTEKQRLTYFSGPFYQHLKADQQEVIKKTLAEPSLFDAIEKWLERTPFLQADGFVFWQEYKTAALKMLENDKQIVSTNTRLSAEEKEKNLNGLKATEQSLNSLFDEKTFTELKNQGLFRMSWKSLQAALLIFLYRDQPALQLPYRFLSTLLDLDEKLTEWRHRHSLMAHRMLGQKIGTGGSSGHDYLRAATEKHKVFNDLFNLTTFFIPRSQLPVLPKEIREKMNFNF